MNFSTYSQYIFNRRLLVVLFLGFSSGLPLALTSSTLQAWYTVSGVSILTIGFLTLVGQPYIYKFIWAPLMDRYTIPWLGRRRGWMFLTQGLLLIFICCMSLIHPKQHPYLLGIVGLLVAFLSASQDITIDAYRTDVLLPQERGMGSAMAVGGYRIAMLVSGGLALILAAKIGWHETYLIMALLMFVGMITTIVAPEPTYESTPPETLFQAMVDPIKNLVSRPSGLAILLFIFIYKLSYELILAMTPTFLLRDLGFSLVQVGTINKGIGFFALILGIVIGGVVLIRARVVPALLAFGALQALGVLGYVFLALTGKSITSLIVVIAAENLFVGMESAAFVAFLMSLCDHRYTAMQFALLSALATVGRIFVGPLGALIVMHSGWAELYMTSFLITIPALVLLWWQRQRFSLFVESYNPRIQSRNPTKVL